VRRYAATTLIVFFLSPIHSDIKRFHPWSRIATDQMDRDEKIPRVAQTTVTVVDFDTFSGISGPTSRRASSFRNFLNYEPNPITRDAQLLSY
jgi:hypothetical protein